MISNVELLSRLVPAAALGSVIGFERERLNWAAGLRTHMLVCVGASLMMLVSEFGFADVIGQAGVILDPSRVAAQVVSGIGFLGAGSILLRGEVVRGLTTAARLWSVAGIWLAVAEACIRRPLGRRSSFSSSSPASSRSNGGYRGETATQHPAAGGSRQRVTGQRTSGDGQRQRAREAIHRATVGGRFGSRRGVHRAVARDTQRVRSNMQTT